MAEVTVQVTEYTVTTQPLNELESALDGITVAYRGHGLWAVTRRRRCLGRDGSWDWEPMPSWRDDEWLAEHRFPEAEALRLAKAAALARAGAR